MGNAHQLTPPPSAGARAATDRGGAAKTWRRTALYGAGTASMLLISMVSSLGLWIVIPWAFMDWSPTLVTSGSMQPLVAPGDVVMIRPVDAAELTPDTVVLYDRPDTGRVLHRILEQLPDGTFRTGGDANADPDSAPVELRQIKGAAVLAVPWIGRPSLWFAQQRIVPLALTGVTLLVVLGLAPRSFDPAYDPWASGRRVSPAEVLLGRAAGSPTDRRTGNSSRLMPDGLHQLVLDRLAAQSAAAQRRTAHLIEGLS